MDFLSYNIATLNINTITNTTKLEALRTFIRTLDLDIVFLQEVENNQLQIPGFNVICNVDNMRRGTAIAIRDHIRYTHVERSLDGRLVTARVNNVTLCCVYAHSGNQMRAERERFFNATLAYYLRHNTPHVILAGDFNCTLRHCDGTSTNSSPSLQAAVNQLQLSDVWIRLKPRESGHTYLTHHSESRLDRIYVSSDLVRQLRTVDTHVCSFSDHKAVSARLCLPSLGRSPGRGFWTLRAHLLTAENIDEFQIRWQYWTRQRRYYQSWLQWWIFYAKPKIKTFYRWKSKAVYDVFHRDYQRLYEQLQQAYEELRGNRDMITNINRIKARLLTLQRNFSQTFVRANESFLAGETFSSFQLGERKKKRTMINQLRDHNGDVIEESEQIEQHVYTYFRNLYTLEEADAAAEEEFASDRVIPNDDETNNAMMNEINTTEIWSAIKTSAANKSPGPDGIPREFYLRSFDVIHREMNLVLNEALTGEFPPEFVDGVIVLVKKKGTANDMHAYRPISLLNVDYKILSRILKSRLEVVLRAHRILGEAQKCGNADKNIFQATLAIKDRIAQLIRRKQKGKLISFDLEQAFDRVSRRFLSRTMSSLGLNERMITLLSTIAERSSSRMMVNGHLSQPLPIQRSVRQGDPLSMCLFVIYLHPLLQRLERVCDGDLIVAYADDISVIATSTEKIERLRVLFLRFERAGGAKLNMVKTTSIDVGFIDQGTLVVPWLRTENKVKILGIVYANSIRLMVKLNWDAVVNNFCRLTWLHSLRFLSLNQKVMLMNTYITSKIWYLASILPPYSIHTAKITATMGTFLWSRVPARVPITQLARNREDGGLKLQLPALKCKALLVNRYLQESTSMPFYKSFVDREDAIIPADLQCLKLLKQQLRTIPQLVLENPSAGGILAFYVEGTEAPKVERNNPGLNWRRIWRNINDTKIPVNIRSELFMFVNEKIETRKLLHVIGRADGENCLHCGAVQETIVHKFSECQRVATAWAFVQRRISTTAAGWRRFSFVDLQRPTLDGMSRNCRNTILKLFILYVTFINKCNNVVDLNALEFAIQCELI